MVSNKTVREVFDLGVTEGQIGVEVEVEGNPNSTNDYFNNGVWLVKRDGSLRGIGSREFVLATPTSPEKAKEAVVDLYTAIKSPKNKINKSMRAGVHVHVNFQNKTLNELFTFLALYYSLEILIVNRFGEDRIGNLFCLRTVDASYVNNIIMTALMTGQYKEYFATLDIRYAACNLTALTSYGSLEFRALETPVDPQPILDWIDILVRLVELAKSFKDPTDVLGAFSAGGGRDLIEAVFGKEAEAVLNDENYKDDLFQGIRAIQLWVFSTNWEV